MKCIIIDDEKTARLSLKKVCEKIEELEICGLYESPIEAISVLQKDQIDLVFLDIHMPDLSGFDFLNSLNQLPQIIITTTDKNRAFEAFEYDVTDYLLKPILLPRFLKAMDKVRTRLNDSSDIIEEETNSIFVNINSRLVKLEIDDILFLEAKGDYVQIRTTDKKHLVHITMKRIQEKLPPKLFIKVHRSYIVNLNKIVDIEDNSILIEEEIIPISRSNREALLKSLNMI